MSIPGWAHNGAKVVCVKPDDDGTLVRDCIYTVQRAEADCGQIYLIIADLPYDLRDGWRIERFRPLISQADDIATHFQAILSAPVKTEEPA